MSHLVSRLGAFGFSSSHNTVLFVRFSKLRCQNLSWSFFYQTKKIVLISGLKIEQHMYKVVYFFGKPGTILCPVIAEITRCYNFTKQINHASAHSQYSNVNFHCKNCLRLFSAMTGKPVHTIRFKGSDSWFRKLEAGVQASRFRLYGESVWRSFVVWSHDPIFITDKIAKFVGTFHLSRRVSDENRACSISIRFLKITDLCVGRSFLMCSHDPIFGTNKNRTLKNVSCERAFRSSVSESACES